MVQEGLLQFKTLAGGGVGWASVLMTSSLRASLERKAESPSAGGRLQGESPLPKEGKGCRRVAIWLASRNYWNGSVHRPVLTACTWKGTYAVPDLGHGRGARIPESLFGARDRGQPQGLGPIQNKGCQCGGGGEE